MPTDNNLHPHLYGPLGGVPVSLRALMTDYLELVYNFQHDPNPAIPSMPRVVPGDKAEDRRELTQAQIKRALDKLEAGKLEDSDVQWHVMVMERMLTAASEEISELRNHLPWKHWKTYDGWKMVDRRELQLEVVDLMHFLLNLADLTGLDGGQLAELFYLKMAENRRRWEGRY